MTGVVVKSVTPKAHSLASVSPCFKKKPINCVMIVVAALGGKGITQ